MADQAKHLVEQVLPPVPNRQWVLSFPHALRWRMAHNHKLTLAIWGIARRAIEGLYRARAARVGPPGHHDSARPGCVMAIQRCGGALNLNVHFHALYTDGHRWRVLRAQRRQGPQQSGHSNRLGPTLRCANVRDVADPDTKLDDAVTVREAHLLAAAERRRRREERLRSIGFEDVAEDARRRNLALYAATKPWPSE